MPVGPGEERRIWTYAAALDARLQSASSGMRRLILAITGLLMLAASLPNVPRAYLDYSGLPILSQIPQHETYGTDTIADMYAARVVLNDPSDMFTRARVEQTPLEAATWTREASAPYPPAVLLTEAGLYVVGDRTGIGFYGMILGLACAFLALSVWYFSLTRWYLFPFLYLNFSYFSERFVYVQDGSYLVMLVVIMASLFAARAGRSFSHLLMALAITMKLSPLYYVKNVFTMTRSTAVAFIVIVFAGLVLPYFVWENYVYIYRYGSELKGSWTSAAGALLVCVPFALVLWYVESRLAFDLEDRVGWGLVPFAMLLAFKMNVARHLLIVLLVPDKRGIRNVAAAVGLAIPALFPSLVPFNASLPAATIVLTAGLVYYLDQIGWAVVRDDGRHPMRTLRMLVSKRDGIEGARPLPTANRMSTGL